MTGNGFDDLEQLRARPEDIPETRVETPATRRRQERRRQAFVMVPLAWLDQLSKSSRRATVFVALHLLCLDWKSKGAPVTLSNLAVAEWGISRREKWRALQELEALGLIAVERRRRQSPCVTVFRHETYKSHC
jgi:hypothetical protein